MSFYENHLLPHVINLAKACAIASCCVIAAEWHRRRKGGCWRSALDLVSTLPLYRAPVSEIVGLEPAPRLWPWRNERPTAAQCL